jgi:hypothetical protein
MGETAGRSTAAPVRRAGRFREHRGLILVAVAGAMAEAGVLSAVAPAARPLAPQVTALAPIAVFHDLRWLFGYHRSWLTFAAGLAAVLLARSAVSSILVRLAWPRAVRKPSLAGTFAANLTLTAVAVALISPAVALVFGVALLPFSWPFLPALAAMVLISAPFSHGGVTASWWRTLPPLPAVGWVLGDFAFLSAVSAGTAFLPTAWAVPAAGLAGLVNARAWYGVTSACARPAVAPAPLARLTRWVPVAPLAAVMSLVLVAGAAHEVFAAAAGRSHPGGRSAVTDRTAGAAGVTASTAHGGRARGGTAPGPGRTADPVLLIEGFGSSCCGSARGLQQAEPHRRVQQFSYRGLGAAGHPIPHGHSASDLPLPLLGDRVAAQVGQLHRETGRPVDLVAESEGTLGIYAALTRHPAAPVGSVVLASPIVAPGQASYPADGREGRDVASGYVLRYMTEFVGRLSLSGPSGAVTLINSVSSVGARYDAAATGHRPVRWLAVVPLADALTLPACGLPANVAVVPGFHGGLLGRPAVRQMVRAFLDGQPVYGQRRYSDASEILAATGAGWRMPETEQPSPPCPGLLGAHWGRSAIQTACASPVPGLRTGSGTDGPPGHSPRRTTGLSTPRSAYSAIGRAFIGSFARTGQHT